ncbi:MAG: ABC transporter ATP-binding protein [Wenzhouxiangella sp.]|nr:ABC transporter ATP-binding protein [Wenzhouxiangella sp.]
MASLLELRNLRYAWPGDDHPVINLASMHLDAGEKVFMFGPSGSGKSTLLGLIAGLISPQQGQIRFKDVELNALGGAGRDRFRAEHLGVIFQQFNLLPWLDLTSNVMLPCRFSKARAARAGDVKRSAELLLASMGLVPELWRRRSDSISVGQQQRVAAARALIGRPDLILADEPTSALDHDRRVEFLDLLFQQIEAAQSTLLFVSHDRELADRFDRAIDLTQLNRTEAQT